jgi:hypothetical protein
MSLWDIARAMHRLTNEHVRKGHPYERVWGDTQALWARVETAGLFSQRRVTQMLGDLAEQDRLQEEASQR